jgi:cytochrome c oxidase cbb3-type subunit 3
MIELGAPALNDQIWLYGGTKAEIIQQVHHPRHGVMPAWIDRLTPETIKALTVYVHSLGGGQ